MGHDVHNVAKHQLDISSLEALAKDLSNRLEVNVEYGVFDSFHFDWDGFHRNPTYNLWKFGTINFPNAQTTLWLTDQFYLFHIVYSRYREDSYILPYFKENESHKEALTESIGNTSFELRDNEEDDEYAIIFNDTFYDWHNYFGCRWWSFCRAFTQEDENEYLLEIVNDYRKGVMVFFDKLGIKETFYFDDQGETQCLTEFYYDWEYILKKVDTDFKDSTLYISEFMKHKKLLLTDHFPLAFYDDFADLK
jgi:hypothetical protein